MVEFDSSWDTVESSLLAASNAGHLLESRPDTPVGLFKELDPYFQALAQAGLHQGNCRRRGTIVYRLTIKTRAIVHSTATGVRVRAYGQLCVRACVTCGRLTLFL